MGRPTIRASSTGHEEQRIGQRQRGDRREEHGGNDRDPRHAAVNEPDGRREEGVVDRADERIRDAVKVGPARFDHAGTRDFPSRRLQALRKHEKRGVEPNTA